MAVIRVLLQIILLLPSLSYAENFFDQRYRGWLWFEEREKIELQKKLEDKQIKEKNKKEEYAKAKEEVEKFKKELEDLRYMMIRYPENLGHVLAYKKKEAEMLELSLKLDKSYRLVNYFVDPDHINLIKNPINLYGRRIKEEIDQKDNSAKIKELAQRVELFLFFSSTCPYCEQLEPILNDFARKYGFKVEAISLDGSESKYFKTYHDAGLATKLQLKLTPTVMLVTNDSEISFELVRGATSLTELEERSALALTYLEFLKNPKNQQE